MQSGIIEFVIGKEKRRFSVHGELASSFPKEIRDTPLIERIDEVVFGRCCEFLYSGDYSTPPPVFEPYGSEHGDRSKPSTGSVGRWNPSDLTRNLFHPTTLSRICTDLRAQLHPTRKYFDIEGLDTDPTDNYSEIFLCHAELYCFAYSTNWTSLCLLSLYHLVQLLANFTLVDERTGDIVKLIQFAFVGSEKNMPDIKTMLRDYALWNAEVMMRNVDFLQLLDKVPSLEKAMFRSMWR